MSARWEMLEDWLFTNIYERNQQRFDVYMVAEGMKITVQSATRMIQSYLRAQRKPESNTLFVLKREGRTRSAVWSLGTRTVDARMIGGTLFEDVETKIRRAFEPDMRRLAQRNKKAAKYVEASLGGVINGALAVLASAVERYSEE